VPNLELLDEIRARGTMKMIPEGPCQRAGISRQAAAHVLLLLAQYASRDGLAWPSLRTMEDDLGVHIRNIRKALEVLVEAKLIQAAGKVGRANRYLLDVATWPGADRARTRAHKRNAQTVDNSEDCARVRAHTESVESPDDASDRARYRARDRARVRALKGREVNTPPSFPPSQPPIWPIVVDGRTDGQPAEQTTNPVDVVLRDVPPRARPSRVAARRAIAEAAAGGWTLEQLRETLEAQNHDYDRVGGGVVLNALREMVGCSPPKRKITGSPRDGETCPLPDHFGWAGNCAQCASERKAVVV
jgi:hypothetical protein